MNLSRSVLASLGLTVVLAALATPSVQAQQSPPVAQQASRGSITGVVTQAATGQPLDQVSVRLLGTSFGAVTNAQGRYTIPNISPAIYSMEAARIGLAPNRKEDIRVVAGQVTTVNFALEERTLVLSTVVTTGVTDPIAGAKAPFSRALVTPDKMPVAPTGDALASLSGKVAGATIRPGAAPGGDLSIQLRSPTSFRGNTQPMIIVDGVIQLQDDPSLASRGIPGGDLDINPEDIASIEIVRGAAAAALYGQRAASGVIVIKTNRGEAAPQGSTRIMWSGEAGVSQLGRKLPLARSHRYLVDANNQFVDQFGRPVENRSFVNDPDQFIDNQWGVPTYDHVDQLFGTGTLYVTNASISQSSLATNFNVQVGGTSESGVLRTPTAGVEQYNIRMNLDHRVGDKLSFALGTYYNRRFQRTVADGANIFLRAFDISPDIDLTARDSTGRYIPFPDGESAGLFNPLYGETVRDTWNKRAGLQTNGEVIYRPTSILQLQAQMGYQRSDRNAQVQFLIPGEFQSDGDVDPGSYDISADFDESVNGQLRASVLTGIREWTLRSSVSMLGTVIKNDGWEVRADTLFQPQPDLDFARRYAADQVRRDQNTKSYAVSAGADYQARYIIDALYRRDGNSLLPPNSRWNDNMRVSGAWSMAEEPWWRFQDFGMFKLRYSIGTAGNNPLFNDQYETYLQNPGTERIFKQGMGNTAIVPEKVTEQEFGLDMSYRNRFGLELSYVRVLTENAIRADTILSYTGFDTQVKNLGDLLGNTIEATLEAQWIQRPNLRWSSTLVADRSRIKIQNYPRRCLAPDANMRRECEGYVFGEMWGSSFARDASEISPRHAKLDANGRTRFDQFQVNDDGFLVAVGPNGSWTDARWGQNVVIDGITYAWGMPIIVGNYGATDSLRTSNAVTRLGQGLPDFQFGFGNNLVFGKWDFFVQTVGQVGGKLYNRTKERLYDLELHGDVDQAGKAEWAKKPAIYYTGNFIGGTGGSSGLAPGLRIDNFIEDAGFLKISELQLRYRFDNARWLAPIGARQASLAFNARNLWTLTGYSGYDPETGSANTRIDEISYPRYRTFSLRAQLAF